MNSINSSLYELSLPTPTLSHPHTLTLYELYQLSTLRTLYTPRLNLPEAQSMTSTRQMMKTRIIETL